jgi:hypothetical protein
LGYTPCATPDPVITFIGIDIGALMGGAIVTERIFNVNGIGNFLYRSITQKTARRWSHCPVPGAHLLVGQPHRRHLVRLPGSEDLS